MQFIIARSVFSDRATGWDISWGDGTFGTYASNPETVSHVYTQTGYAQIQFSAVTYEAATGYRKE